MRGSWRRQSCCSPSMSERPGDDVPNGGGLRFLEEMVRPGFDAGPAILGVVQLGQNDEPGARDPRTHPAQHFESGAADQLDVEQDPVRPRAQDAVHGVLRIVGYSDDGNAFDFSHESGQPLAHDPGVLDDEDAARGDDIFHAAKYEDRRRGATSAGPDTACRRSLILVVGRASGPSESSYAP